MSIQSVSTLPPPRVDAGASHASREARPPAAAAERTPSEKSSAPVEKIELSAAVQSVREYIEPINSGVEFSISDETKEVVIKVVDTQTKEVIRQIPSEEMLAIAKALDSLKGLLIRQKA